MTRLGEVMAKLVIKDLHVKVKDTDKEILKGVNLVLNEGETLALLGPNGHGKSTLLGAIMGNPRFVVTAGSITFGDEDVLALSPDERSKKGFFLAMQNPSEIPGLNSSDFLKAALNSHREKPMTLFQFYTTIQKAYEEMGIPLEMSNRNLNEGFSGGEKKRNEILQLRLLKPDVAMLDEIDSGLDIDAMNVVAEAVRKEQERGASFLVISHYARLYHLIHPTRSAVLVNGKIVVEGGPEIIEKIDSKGYEWIKKELGISIEKEGEPFSDNSIGTCAVKVGEKQ